MSMRAERLILKQKLFWAHCEAFSEGQGWVNLEIFLKEHHMAESRFRYFADFFSRLGMEFALERREQHIFFFLSFNKVLFDKFQHWALESDEDCSSDESLLFENSLLSFSDLNLKEREESYVPNVFKSTEPNQDMLEKLNQYIVEQKAVRLLGEGRQVKVFPHKIFYLDGDLVLVGEDLDDKSLTCLGLDEFQSLEREEEYADYEANFSHMELDDFISSLRGISEDEVRLILKIHSREEIDLNPPYQYLGNPYMVVNPEGETIWAATVEPCDSLYDWILGLGDSVEVLDPTSFKRKLLEYYEAKLKSSQAA